MNIKKLHSQRQARKRSDRYKFNMRKQTELKIEKHKRCAVKEFSADSYLGAN